jgi:hypothetical protein
MNECNQLLLCSTTDPTNGGNCPISRRQAKRDISYLTVAERRAYRDQLLSLRLATYSYKAEAPGRRHLGFIIEDVEPSVAVDPERNMVDLYGYMSLTVAAAQEQARTIEALRREVDSLRREVERAGCKR